VPSKVSMRRFPDIVVAERAAQECVAGLGKSRRRANPC